MSRIVFLTGFVPVRKPGKLPADTISKSYSKEYGVDTIEIHRDAIAEGDVVVLHDDLLATGGTAPPIKPRDSMPTTLVTPSPS